MSLHNIASLAFNRPLLIEPSAAETAGAFLLSRLRGGGPAAVERGAESLTAFPATARPDGAVEIHSPRASRFIGTYPMEAGRPAPYRRTADGTAIVEVLGKTVNRGAWVGASSGLVSYEGLTYSLRRAAADPAVHTIVLDMECPGGEAAGAFETAAVVRSIAAKKPVIAVVNAMAASAGYAIASGASKILTLPSGVLGSIGVLVMHVDFSAALASAGIRPTLIHAGAHKADGNPFEPLSEQIRADIKTEVMSLYADFLATVELGRGKKLNAKKALETEARVFRGREAVDAGLADRVVGSIDDVVAALAASRSASPSVRASASTAAPLTPQRASQAADPSLGWDDAIAATDRLYGRDKPATEASAQPEPAPAIGHGWDEIVADTNKRAGVAGPRTI